MHIADIDPSTKPITRQTSTSLDWRRTATGRIFALAGLLCIWSILMASAPAAAHTDLISSTPASGAVLATAPSEISLTFAEAVSAETSEMMLTVETSPSRVTTLEPAADGGGTIRGAIPKHAIPTAPAGTAPVSWSVTYRVMSADGDSIEDTIAFSAALPEAPVAAMGKSNQTEREFQTKARLLGVGIFLTLLVPLVLVLLTISILQRKRRSEQL